MQIANKSENSRNDPSAPLSFYNESDPSIPATPALLFLDNLNDSMAESSFFPSPKTGETTTHITSVHCYENAETTTTPVQTCPDNPKQTKAEPPTAPGQTFPENFERTRADCPSNDPSSVNINETITDTTATPAFSTKGKATAHLLEPLHKQFTSYAPSSTKERNERGVVKENEFTEQTLNMENQVNMDMTSEIQDRDDFISNYVENILDLATQGRNQPLALSPTVPVTPPIPDTPETDYVMHCRNDLREDHVSMVEFNSRMFYVVPKTIRRGEYLRKENLIRPRLHCRKRVGLTEMQALSESLIQHGINDQLGHIMICRNEEGKIVVVDGVSRVSVLDAAVKSGVLGIGEVPGKVPADFRFHTNSISVRMIIPVDFVCPNELELLSISIYLNTDQSSTLLLKDEDIYGMLGQFAKRTLGPDKTREYYLLHSQRLVQMAMRYKLLDHVFGRSTRVDNGKGDNEEDEENIARSEAGPSNPTHRASTRESNSSADTQEYKRDQYSRYVRSALSLIDCPSTENLLFGRGISSSVWNCRCLSVNELVELDDLRKTCILALMEKRNREMKRKGLSMSPAECRKFIHFMIRCCDTMSLAPMGKSTVQNASFMNLVGARLTTHKDSSVRRSPYFQSLAFFACKWTPKKNLLWSTDQIVEEIKQDFLEWPSSRKWRTHTFDTESIDESFLSRAPISRKLYTKPETTPKRKRIGRKSIPRKAKARKSIAESASEYEDSVTVEVADKQDNVVGVQDTRESAANERRQAPDVQDGLVEEDVQEEKGNQTGGEEKGQPQGNIKDAALTFLTSILSGSGLSSSCSDIMQKVSQDLSPTTNASADSAALDLVSKLHSALRSKVNPPSPTTSIRKLVDLEGGSESGNDEIKAAAEPDAVEQTAVESTIKVQSSPTNPLPSTELRQAWNSFRKLFSKRTKPISGLPEACSGTGPWGYITTDEKLNTISAMAQDCILSQLEVPSTGNEDVDKLMMTMFKKGLRKDLEYKGFVVCPAIFKDVEAEGWIDAYLRYYMEFFDQEGGKGSSRKGKQCPWDWISNKDPTTDEENVQNKVGRFQVRSSKDITYLYRKEKKMIQAKTWTEVLVATLLSHVLKTPDGQAPMRFPVFGSKILVHSDKTERQASHCDYAVEKGPVKKLEQCQYFAIVTGSTSALLHVWPTGHLFLCSPSTESLHLQPELVEIPPFSMCLVRGDLPHAGAGSADDVKVRGSFVLAPRLHFYIDRQVTDCSFILEPEELFYPDISE